MKQIVDIARRWVGTPFHHQARVEGVGVDCVGLVISVAREIGAVPADWDVGGYGRVPDGKQLVHHLSERLVPVAQADMAPGDVVLVAFDSHPQHVGIVGDYLHGGLSIIHASGAHGRVLETRLLFTKAMRFVAAYRFPTPVNTYGEAIWASKRCDSDGADDSAISAPAYSYDIDLLGEQRSTETD